MTLLQHQVFRGIDSYCFKSIAHFSFKIKLAKGQILQDQDIVLYFERCCKIHQPTGAEVLEVIVILTLNS